ncbi:hypothetical protein REPUB_Repub04eG0218700 [Reevesia pubescens]
MKNASNVQLQQRFLGKDLSPRIVEATIFVRSCSKTIILVAGAGYGLDHIAAVDILKAIRSANGFSVAIILKPFSFEGQRRLDEVNIIVLTLQDIETVSLLKNELVTLDDALKTANNAVLLAIKRISVVISSKLIDEVKDNMKELGVSEVIKTHPSQSNDTHKNDVKVMNRAGFNKMKNKVALEDIPTFHQEPLSGWNLGPGHQLAQEWVKERAADLEAKPVLDNLSIFCLPVGVRSSEELKEGSNTLYATEFPESKPENGVKAPATSNSSRSSGVLNDASFEVIRECYNTASTPLKRKSPLQLQL